MMIFYLAKWFPAPRISPTFNGVVLSFTIATVAIVLWPFADSVQGQSAERSDWPQFLGANVDGRSTETDILKDWSDGNLSLSWQLDVGQGYGVGSVAGDKYYHFDLPVNGTARLRCVNIHDGKTHWQFKYASKYKDMYGYDSGPRASPLVDDDRIYIFGVEGMLYCLGLESGKEIWKVNTSEKFGVIQNYFGVASCPVIHKNLLIVMVGGSPKGLKIPPGRLDQAKPNDCGIVAFDKLTGKVKYSVGDDLASYSSLKIAEINDELVGLAWLRDRLIAFQPDTGTIEWSFPWRSKKLESVNASTPVVFGDKVFISECYEIGSALLQISPAGAASEEPDPDSDRVKVLWSDAGKRDQSMATHWNTPVLHDGYLYGCSGRHMWQAEFRCVELATGKVMWSEKKLTRTNATYCDGHLIVMGERGELFLLKATPEKFDLVTTYEGTGKIDFQEPCWAAPIVANGKMFVRGKKKVACFDLKPSAEQK
jgi:outer membrane protein assembly factor BamB